MIRPLIGASALSVMAGLASAATLTYSSVLDPEQAMVSSFASGTASLVVDTEAQTLDFRLDVMKINLEKLSDDFIAKPVGPVHLHNAPIGENGPVVIPFPFDSTYARAQGGFALETIGYKFADAVAISGVDVSFEDFVAELDAGNYYINVHTDRYPGGEIRGQVAPAVAAVPLPAGGLLVLTGLGALGAMRRRRRAAVAA